MPHTSHKLVWLRNGRSRQGAGADQNPECKYSVGFPLECWGTIPPKQRTSQRVTRSSLVEETHVQRKHDQPKQGMICVFDNVSHELWLVRPFN